MKKGKSDISLRKRILRHWQLYLVVAVPLIMILIFSYGPMYGIQIAFRDYVASKGITGSTWVGTKYFASFFRTRQFPRLLGNTIGISLYSLLAGFPVPILLAISLNECESLRFKKSAQMITYAPHFISTVVIVSMFVQFLSLDNGLINRILNFFGHESIYFLNEPKYFWGVYTAMNLWKGLGWGTIIYLSALTGINTELYEACYIDGGGRWAKMWHITLPGISNTIGILLILQLGSVLSVGYESIILMYNPTIYETADVISTYVYRRGLQDADYSFATAVGLFQSVIGLILVTISNKLSAKFTEISIW